MLYNELPRSLQLVTTGVKDRLKMATNEILGGTNATYMLIVGEAPCSVRIFLSAPHDGAIRLPHELNYAGVTEELIKYSYPPPHGERARYPIKVASWQKEGWEIRKITIDGLSAVLAIAAWV